MNRPPLIQSYALGLSLTNAIRALLLVLLGLSGGAFLTGCVTSGSLAPVPASVALDSEDDLRHWFFEDKNRLQTEIPLNHMAVLADIYQGRDYQPLWLDGQHLSSAGALLLQSLIETSADDAYVYAYHLALIQQHLRVAEHNTAALNALDLLLTDAFVAYHADVFSNRLHPTSMTQKAPPSSSAEQRRHHDNVVVLLNHIHTSDGLNQLVQEMVPDHPEYLQLREALQHYQALAADPSWHPLNSGPTLELGMQGLDIGQLRDLLIFYGDAEPPQRGLFQSLRESQPTEEQLAAYNTFDEELEVALKRFQKRHGQVADGRAGPITRSLLNIPPAYRVKQIALNMKRWRELPKKLGERYIWVNITDYQLQLIHDDRTELEMRIIIGTSYRPTPVFQKVVNNLVFNPYWNVPRRLAVNDILPQARKDPEYLTRKHIRVFEDWESTTPIPNESIDWSKATSRNFPYRLRQDPGPHNSLGRIKFLIPDSDAIYLHDTNDPSLFARGTRAMSSGCIRVEKPLELAEALLLGSSWDRKRIENTINSGKTRHVGLIDHIPIYLFYATAWVGEDEQMVFRDDIYGLDKVIGHTKAPANQ